MNTAYDFAKFFVSQGLDNNPNTIDGNMKLQKLLVFAYLICLAKYEKPLFKEDIMAFTNGYVVESVRQKYQYEYKQFKSDSNSFVPAFNEEEKDVLECTIAIYGTLSAKKLSELSHNFEFWSDSYNKGLQNNGFHNKSKSIITPQAMLKEINPIRKVLFAYEQNKKIDSSFQCINGIRFFYSPSEVDINDDLIKELYEFSEEADEESYSLYYDEGNLVIF
jgi:uncharacterized phage-associated protein